MRYARLTAFLLPLCLAASLTACASTDGGPWLDARETDSRQPLLVWDLYPRAESDEGEPAPNPKDTLDNLRYDVRIFRTADGMLVYERLGVPSAEHRVDTPLTQAGAYYWTVRSRFDTAAGTRVGPWFGGLHRRAGGPVVIPVQAYSCDSFSVP